MKNGPTPNSAIMADTTVRRNENSENRIAARTGQQYCGRLVNLFKVILRANLAPKMEESQLTLLQI